MLYRFGDFELHAARYELRRDGEPVSVEPRVLEVLVYLVRHRNRVVPKEELLESLWPEEFVTESALTRAVRGVRQVLDDPSWVKAVYGRGYRFEGQVESIEDSTTSATPPPEGALPQTRGWMVATVLAGVALFVAALALLRDPGLKVPTAPPTDIDSVAVLPFADHSTDPDDGVFAAGLTEALIGQLATFRGLRVISRTSSDRYRDRDLSLPAIARELAVDAILEGSVVQAGDRVRVRAQLIRASTDEPVWADEYDARLQDVLEVQVRIARAVAAAVQVRLSPRDEARLAGAGSIDSEAYRHYLRGRFHWNRRTVEDLHAARREFDAAIRLDPDFAPAHAGLATTYILLSTYYALPPEEAFSEARAAAERALALDPELSEAHATLGSVLFTFDWDFSRAETAYRRAIDLSPGNAVAHQWLGELLSVLGRHEEAVEHGRIAWGLDPLSPIINAALGQRLNAAGRWEEALDQFEQTLELEPRFPWIHREIAYAQTHLGRPDDAVEQRQLEMRQRGIDHIQLRDLRARTESEGLQGFWDWEYERLEKRSENDYVPAILLAEAREGVGDREGALRLLESAFGERGDHVLQLATSPELRRLVRDPAARDLLRLAGLEQLGHSPEPD